jgi:hypothetical protein
VVFRAVITADTPFNVSAALEFISILGIAFMAGLTLLPVSISTKVALKPHDCWAMSSSTDALLTRVLQPDSDLPAALGLAARRRSYSTAGRNLGRGLQIVGYGPRPTRAGHGKRAVGGFDDGI